jgi:collagenase-like PrtC family protease
VKIITGISNSHKPEEIQAYADAGVDEFFIGYVPPEWSDEFGWEMSCNRRETSNYQYRSRQELANVVRFIHDAGRKVYLTLNAHDYNSKQIDLLMRILKDIKDIEFDGFIVSNIAVILELQKNGFRNEINISIGGASNNIETLQFFQSAVENLGRIILPRKLTINEIETLAKYGCENNIRMEAFGMSESCYFNDEFCFTWHGAANKGFCRSPMFESRKVRPLLFSHNWKKELETVEISTIYSKLNEIESEIKVSRDAYMLKNMPAARNKHEIEMLYILANIHKCGLCTFQKFREWEIEAVKLPLRGHSLKANLEIVRITRQVIDHRLASPDYCRKLLNSPNFCSGANCYYNYPYAT